MNTDDNHIKQVLIAELEAEEAAAPASLSRQLVDARRTARLRADAAHHAPQSLFARIAAQLKSRTGLQLAGSVAAMGLVVMVVGSPMWSGDTDSGADTMAGVASATSSAITTTAAITSVESMSLLSSPDDIEFYQSVEFLLWLEQQG